MYRNLAAVALVGMVSVGLAEKNCPPLTSIEPNWPMSRILQDVCRRDTCSGKTCVNCDEIPGLLDALASMGGPDANNFKLAHTAADFMCDPCLNSIRDGIVHLDDASTGKASPITIGAQQAHDSACAASCLPKYKAISDQFGAAAKKAYTDVAAGCSSNNPAAIKKATEDLMHTLFNSLKSVRSLASDPGAMYLTQSPVSSARSAYLSSKAIRVAAFGCLALGTALLVAAAFLSRRPTVVEQRAESELL